MAINGGRPATPPSSSSSSSIPPASYQVTTTRSRPIRAKQTRREPTPAISIEREISLPMARGGGKAKAAVWWCVCAALLAVVATAQDAMQGKCQEDLSKLTDCMDYATGHEPAPSSTCCADTAGTQRTRPECLCYIIQQAHSGKEMQSLGLRFDRLVALPSACKLANANVSLCINLLHLTPSSPDYALFANASKITPSSGTTPASGASTTSDGFKVQTGFHYGVAATVVSAVLSSIF